MGNLTHIFKVGQKVRCKNDVYDAVKKFEEGVVKETSHNHIIVHLTDLDIDMWYEEGVNMDLVFPEYNFNVHEISR